MIRITTKEMVNISLYRQIVQTMFDCPKNLNFVKDYNDHQNNALDTKLHVAFNLTKLM